MTVRTVAYLCWIGICLCSELLALFNFIDPNNPANLKWGNAQYIRMNVQMLIAIPIVCLVGLLILYILNKRADRSVK